MDQILNYVKPKLLVLTVVLYFVGMGLKQAQMVKDKYIPLILGGIGIVLCAVWYLHPAGSGPDRRLLWLYLQRLCREF